MFLLKQVLYKFLYKQSYYIIFFIYLTYCLEKKGNSGSSKFLRVFHPLYSWAVRGPAMILRHRFAIPSPRFVKESIGSQNTTAWYRRDLAAYSGVRSPSSHFLVFLTFLFLVSIAAISSSALSLPSSFSSNSSSHLLCTPPFSYFSRCTTSWVNRHKVPFTPL